MEPVTHFLTGASLARCGLNRRVAYATSAMTIAAEFPDIDTLWGLRGPIASFQHHRGITHTLVGLPFEAAFLVGIFALLHCWRIRGARTRPLRKPQRAAAPTRWLALYGCVLLALLSHILLDYTNNYGVRPFFPFNSHWYAASIVFIFDPLLFALLVGGLVLPSLFGLVGREIGGQRKRYLGVGFARVALLGAVTLWAVRAYEHGAALKLAAGETLRAPERYVDEPTETASQSTSAANPAEADSKAVTSTPRALLGPQRTLANPDPFSVFRWYVATDFGPAYQLSTVDLRRGTLTAGRVLTKPDSTPTLIAAQHSYLGRTYGDWSSTPWLSVVQQGDLASVAGANARTVLFEDTRFLGDSPFLRRGSTPPLTGYVVMGPHDEVLEQGIDGKPQD